MSGGGDFWFYMPRHICYENFLVQILGLVAIHLVKAADYANSSNGIT